LLLHTFYLSFSYLLQNYFYFRKNKTNLHVFYTQSLKGTAEASFHGNFPTFSDTLPPAPTLFVQRLRMLIRSVRLPVRTLRFYIRAL
ncbi:hypothetical protein, partial [Bacteroides heparinolyticus]|uniref:hypothetical protein n=1 Tax=Prevotella heparinolytica TaxID=28113 RepID=UPI00359FACDC